MMILDVAPGQGLGVPGIDLDNEDWVRHLIGDSAIYATRAFVDTGWHSLEEFEDDSIPDSGIHWVRYHLLPDGQLKDSPLLLNVQAMGGFEVFLNGRSLVRSAPLPVDRDTSVEGSPIALPHLSVPVSFACDGRPEVLALRIVSSAGRSFSSSLHVSLHAADTTFSMQRSMVHSGVFIGINIIILLLSLVIWAMEPKERSWLLLALLSLVSAVSMLCELGGALGALGLTADTQRALEVIDTILLPWPMYLLIMVLGMMRGDLTPKRTRRYTIAAVVVTLILIAFSIGVHTGIVNTSTGLALTNDLPVLLLSFIVLGILFAVIVTWFAIAVIRLGIRLLRSTGYARWIGAGALVSSVLAIVLQVISGAVGTGLASWFAVLSDYCSYVAVPVSVAVYLAIRSAHHNRLVARQRDDLDEEVKVRTGQLTAEKERSDKLLLNILPAEVADELKASGEAEAKLINEVTVLFTDFKGFTAMSEQLSPQELVRDIHECFSAFDRIMEKHGIEKIKTIGDSYMAAGGLPTPNSTHAMDVVKAALEILEFIEKGKKHRQDQVLPYFEIRIGIHTGPVVAGIVGVKKFAYDIWGDTVNTASRMESSGEVGQVNISETTFALVKDGPGLTFTARGKVQAKGKGEMEMYFVQRDELSDPT
jgi:class 3 adenylate cyclase